MRRLAAVLGNSSSSREQPLVRFQEKTEVASWRMSALRCSGRRASVCFLGRDSCREENLRKKMTVIPAHGRANYFGTSGKVNLVVGEKKNGTGQRGRISGRLGGWVQDDRPEDRPQLVTQPPACYQKLDPGSWCNCFVYKTEWEHRCGAGLCVTALFFIILLNRKKHECFSWDIGFIRVFFFGTSRRWGTSIMTNIWCDRPQWLTHWRTYLHDF